MTSIVYLGIEDFGNFEFGFIINCNRQRCRLDSIGDRIGGCWFQHQDVENWVYSAETVRKSESDGMGAGSCKDFIQSKEFIGKLLGRSCRMEELSLDISVATNLEFRSWKLSGISRSLVLMLSFSNVLPKFLMKFVEVGDKVTSACGSEVTLRVNCEVWMITLVGKEGCNAGSGTRSIVVSELS